MSKQRNRSRRRHSQAEKQAIIESAKADGVPSAARKYGCPVRTVYGWLEAQAELAAGSGSSGESDSAPDQRAIHKEPAAPELRPCRSRGRRYSPSEKREILDYTAANTIRDAELKFGCAEWTIRRWLKKGKNTTSSASRFPSEQEESGDGEANLTPEQEERHRLVLETWKQQPGLGPTQIRNQLRRQGYKASVSLIRDIMEENGYIQPQVKRKEHTGCYEALRPLQLCHLDFLHFFVHKQKQCLLVIEDDFSRFITGWTLLKSEHADGAIEALDAAIARYGKPDAVMYDRGSAFFSFRGLSRFEAILAEYRIDNIVVDEPQVNGKIEKLNSTLRKELLSKVEFADLADAALRIGIWIEQYNYRRTHMALGGLLVPADRFHGLVDTTMRRIEQGNGGDTLDLLSPLGRALELFRVVCTGGQPAVYLMGKRIL